MGLNIVDMEVINSLGRKSKCGLCTNFAREYKQNHSLPSTVQLLLLAHLYAKTDSASLATLRRTLLRKRYTSTEIGAGVVVSAATTAGIVPPLTCGDIQLSWEWFQFPRNEVAFRKVYVPKCTARARGLSPISWSHGLRD